MPDHASPGLPLLRLLDGLVRSDSGLPGFDGTISVILRAAEGFYCWVGAFTKSEARCGFLHFAPASADAIVLLGDAEAQAILETGDLPESPQIAAYSGDPDLIKKLLDRYCRSMSVAGLRAMPSQTAPNKRRSP